MDDTTGPRAATVGSLIVLAVAAIVVAVAVLGAAFAGGTGRPAYSGSTDASTDGPPPEYAPARAIAEPIPANGTVALNRSLWARGDPKTVVIEYSDRVPVERFRPLVRALALAGHEIRLRRGIAPDEIPVRPPPLGADLAAADAYVRIDPREPMTDEELAAVRAFTDRGGRLVILAEPNRRRLAAGPFGASLETIRTDALPLAAEYGIVFGTRYLYDTARNDGNFRHVLVEPTGAADRPGLGPGSGFDWAALYTATRVSARTGPRNATVVARTLPSTHLSRGGRACPYPVAVRAGNALAVGDTTFVAEGRHAVADNERLIAYVAAFAVRGDQTFVDEDVIVPDDGDEDGDGANATATPTDAGTPTPAAAAGEC